MNKQLQKQLNNETETARYACTGCGRQVQKTSRLVSPLPATIEEYCPKCGEDREFRKLRQYGE